MNMLPIRLRTKVIPLCATGGGGATGGTDHGVIAGAAVGSSGGQRRDNSGVSARQVTAQHIGTQRVRVQQIDVERVGARRGEGPVGLRARTRRGAALEIWTAPAVTLLGQP